MQRDGYTYDPTFGQWFAPGVYDALGFTAVRTLSPAQVKEYIRDNDGYVPAAKNQGLPESPQEYLDFQANEPAPSPDSNAKETDQGTALFSKKQSKADLPPVSESLIQALIDGIPGVRQAAGNARISVVATPAELPVEVLAQAKAQGIPENEIHGVLFNGHAYIVRQNLKSRQDVEEVLAHELLGHGGVHALLGGAHESVLLESFNRAGGIGQIRMIVSRLGVLKELNQRVPSGALSDEQKIAVVDEMLALAQGKAGKLRQAALEWVGKIRDFIMAALDKAGLHGLAAKLDKFDATEAAKMLREMREAVIDGGDIGGQGVAFMVAYHGSKSGVTSRERLNDAIDKWADVVDDFLNKTLDLTRQHVLFPSSPASMQVLGLPDLPVMVGKHALSYANIRLTTREMKSLPEMMADPQLVYFHEGQDGEPSLNFVLDSGGYKGVNVVALKPNITGEGGAGIHYVATLLNVRPEAIVREAREGRVMYQGNVTVPGVKDAIQEAKRKNGRESAELRASMARNLGLTATLQRVMKG